MKYLKTDRTRGFAFLLAVFCVTLIVAGNSYSASMGDSEGYDLDALMLRAESTFDLKAHDAVILLESSRVTITAAGDLKTRTHRVVWIGTGRAIRDHADLRIPWNSSDSALEVIKLRTWREGRWWPDVFRVSETAVVETLPHALALADDYTTMRETMLLHDGVELPCVMETLYEITVKGNGVHGRDGTFVFQQRDPVVLAEFTLETDDGIDLRFHTGNRAPGPEDGNADGRASSQSWAMEQLPRLGTPILSDRAAYAPFVAWSTWKDWSSIRTSIEKMFDDSSSPGEFEDVLGEKIGNAVESRHSPIEKAKAIASIVDENVRSIHYPSSFWMFKPRQAARVWATAYGMSLDRAVLAASLFRMAGMSVVPFLASAAPVDIDVPGLSRFGEFLLNVSYEGASLIYDPSDGSMASILQFESGRTTWTLAGDSEPSCTRGVGSIETTMDLRFTEDIKLEGTGYLLAEGNITPYYDIAGSDDGVADYMSTLCSSVLAGSSAGNVTPEDIEPQKVRARFDVSSEPLEKGDEGRFVLVAGDPAGGIMEHLPHDIHLFDTRRDAPVFLRMKSVQMVRIKLSLDKMKVVYLPESFELQNEAGSFKLEVTIEGKTIVVERSLRLNTDRYTSEAWPSLRALLLEEMDKGHRTIVLE